MRLAALVVVIIVAVLIVLVTIASLSDGDHVYPNRDFARQLKQGLVDPARVLLVFAHPDDESVFFAPTVLALRQHHISTYFLCLSADDQSQSYIGRRRELINLASSVGIPEEHVITKQFLDCGGIFWDTDEVATEIDSAVKHWDINVVISFDERGASGHTNHISCYRGLKACRSDVKRYKLNSNCKSIGDLKAQLGSWRPALNMLAQHCSQHTWWRRLGLIFSRHARVNRLVEL